jgi:hypothetical protein
VLLSILAVGQVDVCESVPEYPVGWHI